MRNKHFLKIGAFLALFFLAGAAPGWCGCAVQDWIDRQASSEIYYQKAGGMFLRGLHKILDAPVEIGYYTYDETKNNFKYGAGIIKGLGKGALWAVDDVLRGTWDVVTALFPDYHGEPGTHNIWNIIKGDTATAEATA